MPTVFRHGAFRFFFYSNEGSPLEPVHVHVREGGNEAKIWLSSTASVADSRGFNAASLRTILKIVDAHRALIESEWYDHFGD